MASSKNQEQQVPDFGHQHFASVEGFAPLFRPIGINRVRKLIEVDPRFPKSLLGGGNGSRRVFSLPAVYAYLALVHAEGFPADVLAALEASE